jgi:HSP20 family protein
MFDLVPWRKRQKGEVSHLHHEFDNLFNRFFRRDFGVPGDPLGKGLWFPTTDILEDKKKITLKVEIPGVEAKDIHVSLDGRRLTIKGEKKQEKEEKEENIHRTERTYGQFRRTIELPAEVDPSKVDASYKRGVLKIELKKTKESYPKKINVKTNG